MKSTAKAAVFIALLGASALLYQSITYTTRETALDRGPIQATEETTKAMPLPRLLGGATLYAGVVLVAIGTRRPEEG